MSSQHWRCSKLAQPSLQLDGQCGGVAHGDARSSTRRTAQNGENRARANVKTLPPLAASVHILRTRACVLCRVSNRRRDRAAARPAAAAAAGVRRRRRRARHAVADASGGDAPLIAAALAFFVAVLVGRQGPRRSTRAELANGAARVPSSLRPQAMHLAEPAEELQIRADVQQYTARPSRSSPEGFCPVHLAADVQPGGGHARLAGLAARGI